jgi:hypothetical protein
LTDGAVPRAAVLNSVTTTGHGLTPTAASMASRHVEIAFSSQRQPLPSHGSSKGSQSFGAVAGSP